MQGECGADAAAEEGLPREAFFVVTLHAGRGVFSVERAAEATRVNKVWRQ